MDKVELMGGKLHLYKRSRSRFWQCYTHLAGQTWRESTKHESLVLAKSFAEEWFLQLKAKGRTGTLKRGMLFRDAAKQFQREYEVLTQGQRSPKWVEMLNLKIGKYLIPFFGDMIVSDITPGTAQEYRIWRAENGYRGKLPAHKTVEDEMIGLRQVLKTCVRHRWLEYVPDFSPPFKASRKVSHRAWFSPEEYRQLYQATRERAKNPQKEMWRWQSEQLHDKVLFLANTGLRPDEAGLLEYRDVQVVRDEATNETILEIEVRGKTGVGYCKSTPGAVSPFMRLKKRNAPKPTDRLFPKTHRQLFNNILDDLNLKRDREGNLRSFYSLRHTYICLRLMEGADIYQIAKNCRTSVEMIEKHYAAHIKNTLDAAAINVRRARPNKPVPPSLD